MSDLADLGFSPTELAELTEPSELTNALSDLKRLTPGGSITIDFLEGLGKYDDDDPAGVIAKAADLVERFDPDGEEIVIPMRIISSVTTLATAGAAKQFDAGANLIIQGTKFFDATDADGSVALAGQIGAAAGFAKSGAKLYLEWNDDNWNFQDVVVAVDFVGRVSGFLSSVGIATNTFTTVSQVASGLTQLSKGIDV